MPALTARDLNARLAGCYTVAELIEALNGCDPDAYVMFRDDYGDRGHTVQALLVSGHEQMAGGMLCKTGYSRSELAIRDEDDDGADAPADADDFPQLVMLG